MSGRGRESSRRRAEYERHLARVLADLPATISPAGARRLARLLRTDEM